MVMMKAWIMMCKEEGKFWEWFCDVLSQPVFASRAQERDTASLRSAPPPRGQKVKHSKCVRTSSSFTLVSAAANHTAERTMALRQFYMNSCIIFPLLTFTRLNNILVSQTSIKDLAVAEGNPETCASYFWHSSRYKRANEPR